ncbi:hypothetical protein BC941DRAFT_471963 [Chlamydoabsidia padenii]|nr:hypothetical protein BC941DRAFT_471963 [Chlamydoabsidia padenii]
MSGDLGEDDLENQHVQHIVSSSLRNPDLEQGDSPLPGGQSTTKRWDRIRQAVKAGASENSMSTNSRTTPSSSTTTNHSSPSTSRTTTPLSTVPRTGNRNPLFGPFSSKSQQLNTAPLENHHHRVQNNFMATTITAAQAAGMNNYGRHFGRHFQGESGGGIYATTTSVQQDIYRLERDLQKVLLGINNWNRHASFSTVIPDTDLVVMNNNSNNPPINQNVNQIPTLMSSIMETIQSHKLSNRLPLLNEILMVLIIPFQSSPIQVNVSNQALDIFDYINERFKYFDTSENFELLLFCSRLLAVDHHGLKMRVISTMKTLVTASSGRSNNLPSTPSAFHSLVYTLTDSLAHHTLQTHQSELAISPQKESDFVYDSILDLLDRLANGNLIPVLGKHWDRYSTTLDDNDSNPPVAVAQLCVVEGLCKALMVGRYGQADPYKDISSIPQHVSFESAKDKLILQTLLKRYWIEPTSETHPAFMQVLFVLAEAAIEKFLNGFVTDLMQSTSTVYLVWTFIQDKIHYSKLNDYLPDKSDDRMQQAVATNITHAAMAIMSITPFEDSTKPLTQPHSPNLAPQQSTENINEDRKLSFNSTNIGGISSSEVNLTGRSRYQSTIDNIKKSLVNLWNSGYGDNILSITQALLEDSAGERVVTMYTNLAFYLEDTQISEEIVKNSLPILFRRLTSTYPAPFPSLCQLLLKLSQKYRPIFYKPMVSCVASDDHDKVVSSLTLISCLRRYMSGVQLWMRDAEMINVLLLSDVGRQPQDNNDSGRFWTDHMAYEDPSNIKWGTTTLGQCVVAAELLWVVRELRHQTRNIEEDEIAKKFLIDLERRFAVFMTAKEKLQLIPMPLRVVLCNLLLDMRFFCNTTHRPGWLTRAIDWATQQVGTVEYLQQLSSKAVDKGASPLQSDTTNETQPIIHLSMLNDIALMFERMTMAYTTTLDQLEFESSEHIEYGGERPMTMLPQNNRTMEDVHASVLNDPLTLRSKRQLVISMMYPINRQASASLDLSPPALTKSDYHKNMAPATEISKTRLMEMTKTHQDPFAAVFSLLAAVFTTLAPQEFTKLVRPLWERFMDTDRPHVFVPAAFLFMQCSEKIPKTVIQITSHDFYSDDPRCRTDVILKHASLSAYRLNILAQDYILISSKRRPFCGDGGAFATPFVPTDLGSNRFTMDEPRWMAKLKNASNFPIELKRQIQELGWDDDDKGEEYEALKKVLTPLTLLPSLYLDEEYDRMEDGDPARRGGEDGKSAMINKMISRRKRATVVSTANVSFLSMVDSLCDDFGGVHSSLRELLEGYQRDDPDLFLRGLLGDLGKNDLVLQRDALTRLSHLVNMQAKLPPAFTHILFNYLAGMLKWLTRETTKHGFALMSLIHPIIAQLVLSTNELSTRDLRKNKIETLLSSTGRFWFVHEQPISMFPRRLMDRQTSFTTLDIPDDTFGVAMLRISHIQFLTNFLIRYPREVYAIKKTLQDYEPTPVSTVSNIEGYDNNYNTHFTNGSNFPDIRFLRRSENGLSKELGGVGQDLTDTINILPRPNQEQEDTSLLSLLRARIWLRFIDTLLNGLNKNYNDRKELERILSGVNDIITKHSTDYGLIGQALILYTRVVTRFKRLFSSNHGYGAFLSALFKVYCQAENYPHIRSAITFAWCRFYAVHEESFVFQMLGILAPWILKAYTQSTTLGTWMINNLFSLMKAMDNPPRLGATSDVLGLQLQVELDDHERSIQERIDVVSNPMTMPLSTSILKPLARSVTAPIAPLVVNNYINRPFHLSDFIKLFLTIIAYDPGSLRAEQFVKIYRHLLPLFLKIDNLSSLIGEGMAALVDVFAKFSKTATPLFGSSTTATETGPSFSGDGGNMSAQYQHLLSDSNTDNGIGSTSSRQQQQQQQQQQQHSYGKYWQQNDRVVIKMEFVKLMRQYFELRGTLSEGDQEKMGQVVRSLLRDYGVRGKACDTFWVKDYLVDTVQSMVGMRNYTKAFKKILQHILSQWKSYHKTMDASGIYEGLKLVLQKGQGKSFQMNDIASLIKDRFVTHGLSIVNGGSGGMSQDKGVYDKFCHSLVGLLVMMMENSPLDVLGEIEKMPPTVALMGKVVIPICLQFGQQSNHSLFVDSRFRRDPTDQWMRLLAYALKTCSQESLLKYRSSHGGLSLSTFTSGVGGSYGLSDEGNSGVNISAEAMEHGNDSTMDGTHDNHNKKARISASAIGTSVIGTSASASTATLLSSFGFIAIKLILIRGGKSFGNIKGVWTQLAYFIKDILLFGDTINAYQKKSRSGLSSPLVGPPSPLSSPLFNEAGTSNPPNNVHSSGIISSTTGVTSSTQLLFDFTGWNLLEFVMYYKTPLILLLGALVEEKAVGISSSWTTSLYPVSPTCRSSYSPRSPHSPDSQYSPASHHPPTSKHQSTSQLSPTSPQHPPNSPGSMTSSDNTTRWKSWGHNTLSRKQRRRYYSNSIKSTTTMVNNTNSQPASPLLHDNDGIDKQHSEQHHQLDTSSVLPSVSPVDVNGLGTTNESQVDIGRTGQDDNTMPNQQHNSSRRSSHQHLNSTLCQVSELRNRSIENIQALIGFRSSCTNNKPSDIRTWSYGDAIQKVTSEWVLVLKVQNDFVPLDTKSTVLTSAIGEPLRE